MENVSSSVTLSDFIYRCNIIPHYTTDIGKLTLKLISEKLKIQNGENITEVEKKRVENTLTSRQTMKPQNSERCGIVRRTD